MPATSKCWYGAFFRLSQEFFPKIGFWPFRFLPCCRYTCITRKACQTLQIFQKSLMLVCAIRIANFLYLNALRAIFTSVSIRYVPYAIR